MNFLNLQILRLAIAFCEIQMRTGIIELKVGTSLKVQKGLLKSCLYASDVTYVPTIHAYISVIFNRVMWFVRLLN